MLLGLGVLLVNRNEALPLHLKTARHGGYSLENKIAAEATLEHLAATRAYHAAIDAGQADFAAGRVLSHDAFLARRASSREKWLAGRGA